MGESMQLKTLLLDTDRNICILNGINISKNTSELHMDFENGMWTLTVTQTATYTANVQVSTESV